MTKQPHSSHTRETGQAIILIVFVFIGLLAAVGLVVDLGRYLVAQTQLRRAVDAAALAGAAQFRLEGSTATDAQVYAKVNQAARDTLLAHNISTATIASAVVVDTKFTDPSMETNPPTKKVRVRITEELPLIFLSLIGFRTAGLNAEAVTEAASVDVALIIDISDSMASDLCGGGDYPCVYTCDNVTDTANYNTHCFPFQDVKRSASAFIDQLSPGYDRVTVIPFGLYTGYCVYVGDDDVNGDGWKDCNASAYDPPAGKNGNRYVPLTTNFSSARDFIMNLNIAIPSWAGSPPGYPVPPCPLYSDNPPAGGPPYSPNDWDPRQCTNTNIGGGIHAAAIELLHEFDPAFAVVDPQAGQNHPSKERLRVMILLTDGAANASSLGAEPQPNYGTGTQLGFCPQSTWYPPAPAGPFCRASSPGFTIATGRHISTSVAYDAVDYALDWADFSMLGEAWDGNGIVVFTIGLGDQVINNNKGVPDIGEKLLRYIADGGDDGDPTTKPCSGVAVGTSCGNYYFAPTGNQLAAIFNAIAGRIFTRINN